MKKLILLLALPFAVHAAETAPAAPDYQSIATVIRQQRDSATQALQDAQLQLALAQQQIQALTAKVAELTPKPKPVPVAGSKPVVTKTQPATK